MPRRRTFAEGILPSALSLPAALSASMPPLAAKAGSRGMGSPKLARRADAMPSGQQEAWHAVTGSQKQTGPHDVFVMRACVVKIRQYLLSRLWHYHRLWKLNCRVRDGNGCDLPDMVTGKFPYVPLSRHEYGVVVTGINQRALDTSGQAIVR